MSFRIQTLGGAHAGTIRLSDALHIEELLESLQRDGAAAGVAIRPSFDRESGELLEFVLDTAYGEAAPPTPEFRIDDAAAARAKALELAIDSIAAGDIVIILNGDTYGTDVFARADAFHTYITGGTR